MTGSLSDIQKGSRIAVQSSGGSASAVTATSVTIILPEETGVVTNVNGSTLTITSLDGSTHVITTSSGTAYQKAGASETASDVVSGSAIMAEGTLNSDGSMNAKLVTIEVPSVAGQVASASNGSYTLTSRFGGTTITVNTTSSTVYVNQSGATVAASTITKGTNIIAQGTLSADGQTLTALRIQVLPAMSQHGGFGGPGFGMGGQGAGAPATSPATTSLSGV